MQFMFEVFLLKNNMIYDVTDWRAKPTLQRNNHDNMWQNLFYITRLFLVCHLIYFFWTLNIITWDRQ